MKKSIGSGRGSVYNIILKALQSGDKYGYEICKEVEEKTNGSYILKQPSLYSGLKRLEAQGDVKSYWRDSALGGRRHYYSLTDSGLARIESSNFNWQDARDDIVDTLFEKSELDKTIEDATSEIDNLKAISSLNEENQQNIDEVLKATENLANQNTQNDELDLAETTSNNDDISKEDIKNETYNDNKEDENRGFFGGDLFSMFQKVGEEKQDDEHFEDNNQDDEDEEVEPNLNVNSFDEEPLKEDHEEIDDAQSEYTQDSFDGDLFSMFKNQNIDDENVEEDHQNENAESQEEKYGDLEENEDATTLSGLEEQQVAEFDEKEEYAEKAEKTDFADIERNLQTVVDETDKNDEQLENNQNFNFEDDINGYDKSKQDDENLTDYSTLENDQKNIENFDSAAIPDLKENQEDNLTTFEYDDIQENEKVVIMQKNEDDILEQYKKEHAVFGTYSDSSIYEEPERNNFYEKEVVENNYNPDENNNQSLNETGFEDINNNFENKTKEVDVSKYNEVIDNKNELDENRDNKLQTEVEQAETKAVDYRDIFGDLISDNNQNKQQFEQNSAKVENLQEITDEYVYNRTNVKTNEYESNNSNFEQESQAKELPRNNDNLKDINRTLMFDISSKQSTNENAFEKYDTVEENPFEKYDSYQNVERAQKYEVQNSSNEQSNNIISRRTNNMSFDKKYANTYNKFEVPDYEVRYFRKADNENTATSRFLSINKLNLAVSFVISILILLATTVTLVFASINANIVGFQMALFIASYLIAFGTLMLNFLKYCANKTKKVQNIGKNQSMYTIFASIMIVILTISINLLFGMNIDSILNYSASFILPIAYALILLLIYPIKKFLSKFANFYN